jgi:hypothetical protein
MKIIIFIIFLFFSTVNFCFATSSIYLLLQENGPVIKGYSKYCEIFVVNINNQSVLTQAEDDGYLYFNLYPLKLSNGKYRIKITPTNNVGGADTIEFDLQITGKKPKLWRIIPLKNLLSDPEYKNAFSEDLNLYF